jgi:hypothetical protein
MGLDQLGCGFAHAIVLRAAHGPHDEHVTIGRDLERRVLVDPKQI